MAILKFILIPEGIGRLHDALTCFSRFSEHLSIQASENELVMTTMNTSSTAYLSCTLQRDLFLQSYQFQQQGFFTCRLSIKALSSVFRGDTREKETAIERCEVIVEESPEKAECRLVVSMVCKHGVKKLYKLHYEAIPISHASFKASDAHNQWSISARSLKMYTEFFGPKTEQLDFYHEGARATLTSYTEKVVNGDEILKQPLQTSVAIDVLDFDQFSVEEKIHIGINVKDFRAIVIHAETLKTRVSAMYSYPKQPMQLTYSQHGMSCKFVLMTMGDYRGATVRPVPAGSTSKAASKKATPMQAPVLPVESVPPEQRTESMAPPTHLVTRSFMRDPASERPTERHNERPSRQTPPPPQASINQESLFLSDDEDESKWGEKTYDGDEYELGWTTNDNSRTTELHRSITRDVSFARSIGESSRIEDERRVAPTQRVSDIPGIFGDE